MATAEKATDIARRILTVGIGAVFLTEEGVRSLVKDFKLPTEFLNSLLESASKTRNEFFKGMSHDVVDRIMQQVDPKELIQEVLEQNDFTIEMKIHFKKK